jgi:uncharacterized protein YbaA (DUF1428 family)
MSYVDGFILPVPEGNKEAYREMAATAAPIFREHGALHVVEAWGNDLPRGKTTDFFMADGKRMFWGGFEPIVEDGQG